VTEPARPSGPRLTDAQRELAGRPENIALAHRIADRLARRHGRLDGDTYRASALYGLVLAALAYLPTEGAFKNFARRRIAGQVFDDLRELLGHGFSQRGRNKDDRVVCLTTLVGRKGLAIGDLLAAAEGPIGWEVASADAVLTACRDLSPRSAAVVAGYFLEAATGSLKSVGKALNICEGSASRALDRAVEELRHNFGVAG
jgi:DNA-directed RNA polymerase specialized sigma subunit